MAAKLARFGRVLPPASLFAVNAWIAWRLFWIGATFHHNALHGISIALARHIRDHGLSRGWWPYWHAGMPFENTYQPLLPALTACISLAGGVSPGRAYHLVMALAYCLGPVTLFLLARRLSSNTALSFLAGLLSSLVSPMPWLVEEVRVDLGSPWGARRLWAAIGYADTPHLLALALIPAAILFCDLARERRSPTCAAAATIVSALVILTNLPGAIVLAIAVGCYLTTLPSVREAFIAAAPAAFGGVLSSFWLSPAAAALILANTFTMEGDGTPRWAPAAAAAILLAAAALVLWRLRAGRAQRFFVMLALATGFITLGAYWFHLTVIPQPRRFQIAFEFALIAAAVFTLGPWIGRNRLAARIALILLACFCAFQTHQYRAFARSQIVAQDMTLTAQYRTAAKLHELARGDRVFATGATAFWLNAWFDVPQVTGCCDQGPLHQSARIASYVIGVDPRADVAVAWMRALGARFAAVHEHESAEPYHDVQHPRKFHGILKEVWRERGDVIYELPYTGLAHALYLADLVARRPVNGLDIAPLQPYLKAIAQPGLRTQWLSADELTIEGEVQPGQLISLQISHHPDWTATAGDRPVPLRADALGLLVIEPACAGPCRVHLRFRP
ncbi:MAG: hypothetical protein K2X35_22325 [Bryobacteraceae bacterium]|nr:hypothetical protein [Bryobacteraceae bacterium]